MAATATLSPFMPTSPFVPAKSGFVQSKRVNGKIGLTFDGGRTIGAWLAFPASFKADTTKCLLFEVQDLFLDIMAETSMTDTRMTGKKFRATVFKQFTETSAEIIAEKTRSKSLALFSFVSGKIQRIWVHKDWVAEMKKNDAFGELVIDFGGEAYSHPEEDFGLTPLTEEGYNQMLAQTLIKV